jgi:hypothetical protein
MWGRARFAQNMRIDCFLELAAKAGLPVLGEGALNVSSQRTFSARLLPVFSELHPGM